MPLQDAGAGVGRCTGGAVDGVQVSREIVVSHKAREIEVSHNPR